MFKSRLTASFLLLLIAICLSQFVESDQPTSFAAPPEQHHKVIAPSGIIDHNLPGIRLWHDYGAFALYQIADSALAALPPTTRDQIQLADTMDTIWLEDQSFNPQEGWPAFPKLGPVGSSSAARLQLIQFVGPIKDEWLATVASTGSRLVHYIANNGYLVWGDETARARLNELVQQGDFLQYSGLLEPGLKLGATLAKRLAQAGGPTEVVPVWIQLFDHGDTLATAGLIKQISVDQSSAWISTLNYRTIAVTISTADIAQLAQRPDVVWIGERFERTLLDEGQTQILAGHLIDGPDGQPTGPGYLAWLQSLGFSQNPADYPIVDIVDDGIGSGTTSSGDPTLYQLGQAGSVSRLAYLANCTAAVDSGGLGGHGHLNVSIAGGYDQRSGFPYQDEQGFNRGLGVNPFGRFAGTKIFNGPAFDLSRCAGSDTELLRLISQHGARIASNSWGCAGCATGYDVLAQAFDVGVRDADLTQAGNQELTLIVAAGNSGPASGTINSPGNAKNVITVGAAENYRPTWVDGCHIGPDGADNAMDMADFSSRGPAPGGRAKPELVAPGTHIFGTASTHADYTGHNVCDPFQPDDQTTFAASSGTSHATPAVAGAASLIYRWLQNSYDLTPSPAMLKAYLMAHPTYLTGHNAHDTLPSYRQGYGLPNLSLAFDETPRYLLDQSVRFDRSGETWTFSGQVADPTKPVRVVLAYTDQAGAVGASPQVNNLDLSVQVDTTSYHGNHFSGPWSVPGGSVDAVNNYEAVFLPPDTTGNIKIVITAFNIAGDGIPNNGDATDQDFALVCYNCAETPGFRLQASPERVSLCTPNEADFNLQFSQILGFAEPVSLSISGLPPVAEAQFDPAQLTPPGSSRLTIFNTGATPPGSYQLLIQGSAGPTIETKRVILDSYDHPPAAPTLLTPPHGSLNQPTKPVFTWAGSAQAESYTIELATDANFTEIIETGLGLPGSGYIPQQDLKVNTRYYWRVRAENGCGQGQYSSIYTFLTAPEPGFCPMGTRSQLIFQTGFETGSDGWAQTGTTPDGWTMTDQRTHSGQWAFHAPGSEAAGEQQLLTPEISLPENSYGLTLQFWNHQTIEDDVSGCWDGAVVEVSTDGRHHWQSLETHLLTDPYDGQISSLWSNPLGGQPGWCGDPQDWLNSVVDLSDFAGRSVQFRFLLGTDRSIGREGWYIDDVLVQGCASDLILKETVGTDPAICAATDQITVEAAAEVTYCYEMTNTGSVTYTSHSLIDQQFGPLLAGFPYTLEPGAGFTITRTAVITQAVFNSTTWAAFDEATGAIGAAIDGADVIIRRQTYFLPLIIP